MCNTNIFFFLKPIFSNIRLTIIACRILLLPSLFSNNIYLSFQTCKLTRSNPNGTVIFIINRVVCLKFSYFFFLRCTKVFIFNGFVDRLNRKRLILRLSTESDWLATYDFPSFQNERVKQQRSDFNVFVYNAKCALKSIKK